MIEVSPLYVLSIVPLSIVAAYVLLRSIRKVPAFAFLLLAFWSFLTKFASVLFLDTHSVLIVDSGFVSGPSFATILFLVQHGVIFLSAYFVCYVRRPTRLTDHSAGIIKGSRRHAMYAFLFCATAVSLQFVNVAMAPSFNGAAVSRAMFWETSVPFPILAQIFGILMFFVPFTLSMCLIHFSATKDVRWRQGIFGVLILYVAMFILAGQRFNGLNIVMLSLLAIYFVHRRANELPLLSRRIIIAASLSLACMLTLGAIDIAGRAIGREAGAAQGTLNRVLVLQGSTYWVVFERIQEGMPLYGWNSLLRGREAVIEATLGPTLASIYIARGVNLAGSIASSLSLIVGTYAAIPLLMIYGCLLGLVMDLIYKLVRSGSFLAIIPASYIWFWVIAIFWSGSLENVLAVKFVLFLAATFILRSIEAKIASGPARRMRAARAFAAARASAKARARR